MTRLPAAVRAIALGLLVTAAAAPSPVDRDGDGAPAWTDCDDRRAGVHPGAGDAGLDGVDQDCDGRDSLRGSNVVLVTVDTLRARNLGAYGYARETSPHLDALAAEGVLFEQAYAPSPWTLPSLATVLTGRSPVDHGAVEAGIPLPPDVPTLADLLKAEGYATATWIVSAYPLFRLGFARSFDVAELYPGGRGEDVRRWIAAHAGEPFFLWLHFYHPHTPYNPPPTHRDLFTTVDLRGERLEEYWNASECRMRYEEGRPDETAYRLALYDACIRHLDDALGALMAELEALRLTERTLVVVTADHGEEFFEHRGCDHGTTLYDEVLHVPLVLRHPGGVPAGTRVTAQVGLDDVLPTIIDLLDVEPAPGVGGRSLVPAMHGDAGDRVVVSGFSSTAEPGVSIRHGRWKYIRSPRGRMLRQAATGGREELYDLRSDPGERRNLAAAEPERVAHFAEKADRWLARRRPASTRVRFGAQTVERLRSLGYLGGRDATARQAAGARP